jgi:hypothetical protein
VTERFVRSGGQTGVDRGGLDAAIELGLAWGGWAPRGLRAEDGRIPEPYASRMRETEGVEYSTRTRFNVRDSEGTLLVSFAEILTGGSASTAKCARRMGRPRHHLVLWPGLPSEVAADRVLEWLRDHAILVLNVAGPRESKEPGIQLASRRVLVPIFRRWAAL